MARLAQNEAGIWSYLGKHVPNGVTAERIEARNPPGISDVYWHEYDHNRGGISGWIELKSQVKVIRKEQRLFLQRMRRDGIKAVILAEYGHGLFIIDPMKVDLDLKLNFSSDQVIWYYEDGGQHSVKDKWLRVWEAVRRA